MNEKSDIELLREYVDHRHEAAFREIVARHTDFIYSAALRQVVSTDLAADLTQNVFVDLARKADSLAKKFSSEATLIGWLHRALRFAVLNHWRETQRRSTNERQAMEQLLMDAESGTDWEKIRPLLDEALDDLNDADREILLLRYFKNLDFRAVGQQLNLSEDAAQKRVSRAVERLRDFFSKRKITIGASGLVVLISANAVQSAPVGLAAIVSTAVILTETTLSTSTAIAVTKTIAMTTLQKTLITVALVAAVGTGIFEAHQAAELRKQNQFFQQQQASLAGQIRQLLANNDSLSNQLAGINEAKKMSAAQFNELLKLRGKMGQLQELNAKASEDDARESLVKSWLAREDQLKQLTKQYADKAIPEFQLLSEQQWLDAAMGAKLDTDKDVQQALANLRRTAENNFASQGYNALRDYLKANNGQFPTDLSQLQSYFSPPMDDAILQRWEIAPGSVNPSVNVGDMVITEKSPVDAATDQQVSIGANGFGMGNYQSPDFNAAMAVLKPVAKAYAAANNGKQPTDPSQILPYLTTPEQQAAYQALMKKNAAQ